MDTGNNRTENELQARVTNICGMDLANPILKSSAWKGYWGSFDTTVPLRRFPKSSLPGKDDGHSFRGACDFFPFWRQPLL